MCAAIKTKEKFHLVRTCGINGLLCCYGEALDPVVCTHMVKRRNVNGFTGLFYLMADR